MKVRPYYAGGGLSARFYDVVTAADPTLAGDVDIYADLAPIGGKVLELGAGSGRVTEALARRGLHVTGVEIAPAMLEQALARRQALPPDVAARIALRRGDMTALALGRTFDLAIAPFFTLAHLPAGAAWRNAFAGMARHLAAGGRAAVHLPRLEVMRRPWAGRADLPVMDQPLADGRRLLLFVRERSFREDVGRLDQVVEYALADRDGRIVERSAERLTYWMADPQSAAQAAGLALDGAAVAVGAVGDIWVFRKV